MLKLPRLTICLLVVLSVVASGCGSTEKTASTNASTSAPNKPSPQTVSQSTSSTQAQHTTSKARETKAAEAKSEPQEKAAEAKRHGEQQASKKSAEAAKPKLEAAAQSVPRKKQYDAHTQLKFMKHCEAAKGSHLSCECILVKQELAKVETGQSLAEILAIEFALQKGVSLPQVLRQGVPFPGGSRLVHPPRGIRRSIAECVSASK